MRGRYLFKKQKASKSVNSRKTDNDYKDRFEMVIVMLISSFSAVDVKIWKFTVQDQIRHYLI